MRCLQCGALSFNLICASCAKILGELSLQSREAVELKVYYFYSYDEIKRLLFSKHNMHGSAVYKRLASLSFARFAELLGSNFDEFLGADFRANFSSTDGRGPLINALPLDDRVDSGYSHTAILARALKCKQIKPLYNALKAQNRVKYAGKSLDFRRKNPRNFKLLKPLNAPVILVDDIITSSLSMQDAHNCLKKAGANVLFGLVLADARD